MQLCRRSPNDNWTACADAKKSFPIINVPDGSINVLSRQLTMRNCNLRSAASGKIEKMWQPPKKASGDLWQLPKKALMAILEKKPQKRPGCLSTCHNYVKWEETHLYKESCHIRRYDMHQTFRSAIIAWHVWHCMIPMLSHWITFVLLVVITDFESGLLLCQRRPE